MTKLKTLAERFAGKFVQADSSSCWEWTGAKYPDGYGQIMTTPKKYEGSHRDSYKLFKGEIPAGMCVCHSCDNPGCVNPDHLFLGTHRQNMEDKAAKGRSHKPKGQKNGRAKLSPSAVNLIRLAAKRGIHQRFLGRWFGVSKSMIGNVMRQENWCG